ncbi:MAG: hypothetical protein E6Q88_08235 [Lysobacteraceae bacterium]|nr:MAG: hypothetical protein E6Q88_08235 [Xanthomonadaceae bacterium]
MNAMASNNSRPRPHGAALTGLDLFWNGVSPVARWAVLSCFAPFAAIDLWRGALPSLYILAMFLWWLWVPQIAVMQRDARLERLPGVDKAVSVALLFALIPLTIAFALSGKIATLAYFIAICATGILFVLSALNQLRWIMLAILVCMLGDKLAVAAFGTKLFVPAIKSVFAVITSNPVFACVALAGLIALAVRKWLTFVRLGEISPTAGTDAPLALMGRLKAADQDPMDALMTGISFGLLAGVFKTRPASIATTPLSAMRTLCGPLFVPLSKMQYLMRALAAIVGLVFVLVVTSSDYGVVGGFFIGMIALAMCATLMLYPLRIWELLKKPSGDVAELAMLPGWGDGDNAKRMLLDGLWRTLRPEFLSMFLLLAPLPFVLWFTGKLSLALALAYLPAIAMLQLSIVCATLALLSGKTSNLLVRYGIYPASALFIALSVLLFCGPINAFWQGVLGGVLGLSLLLLVMMAVVLVPTLRAYRKRPHPFLGA